MHTALGALAAGGVRTVSPYASALTWFLSATSAWDRTSPPDLKQLLTLEGIDRAVTAANATAVTAKNRRAWLRQTARMLDATPDQAIADRGLQSRPAEPLLVAGAQRPISFTALVHAWQEQTGRSLTGDLLYPVAAALGIDRANATGHRPVTVTSPASIRTLVEANDAQVIITTSQIPPSTTPLPSRKIRSRRAMLQLAKEMAAADVPVVAAPELDTDVRAAVLAYHPSPKYSSAWITNRELAERLALGYRPASPRDAKHVCSILAGFLTFTDVWPARAAGRIQADELTEDLVAAWIVAASLKDSSRATFRTAVRRAIRSLNPGRAPIKVAYRAAMRPYTAGEMVVWRRLASAQPTKRHTATLSFVVGLGAGAGLDGADLRTVRASSITIAFDGDLPLLTVTTENPRRPRTVPIRTEYARLVQEALVLHAALGKSPDDLVVGRVPDRVSVTRRATRTARTATEDLTVDLARLRNTWLVSLMCAPVPLADLLRAAGLIGSRTLADLLVYCPPTDADATTRTLTAIGVAR